MLEDPTSARSKARTGFKPLADAHHVSWTRNAFRQLKLIGPGAAITYLLGTVDKFEAVLLGGDGSFGSKVALVAFGNALAMVILFLYILFLMYQRGEHLDVRIPMSLFRLSFLSAHGSGALGDSLALCQP
ncbi:hypothetical protein AN958_00105 [Leucoagaricus sp. SymC.cos]|nr:hypothetical protein AN958_00105 [Leucoagaricus sp. SymC.cos]